MSTVEVHRIVGAVLGRSITADVLGRPVDHDPFDEALMAEYAEMFYQHLLPQNMVSSAFETAFGVTPTPLPAALSETITWFRGALDQSGLSADREPGAPTP